MRPAAKQWPLMAAMVGTESGDGSATVESTVTGDLTGEGQQADQEGVEYI